MPYRIGLFELEPSAMWTSVKDPLYIRYLSAESDSPDARLVFYKVFTRKTRHAREDCASEDEPRPREPFELNEVPNEDIEFAPAVRT